MIADVVLKILCIVFCFGQLETIHNSKSIVSSSVILECPPIKIAIPAKFPGGSNAWKQYLSTNTYYPRQAIINKIEGVLKVEYVINEEGIVTSVHAINNIGFGLSEEAEKVIKASPKWKPAKLDEKNIHYRFIQNFTFKLI